MKHSRRDLPHPPRTAIIRLLAMPAVFIVLLLSASSAAAQEKTRPASDELDVTMQIIVDPDAKLPDEVVRRIPLPARKPDTQASGTPAKPGAPQAAASEAAAKGQERAREAQELGKEMSETAKERAQEANDQREQARRSMADEQRKKTDPPEHPAPPQRPPR